MTDDEFELLRQDIEELEWDTVAALAAVLGGDPDDYLVDECFVGDEHE